MDWDFSEGGETLFGDWQRVSVDWRKVEDGDWRKATGRNGGERAGEWGARKGSRNGNS